MKAASAAWARSFGAFSPKAQEAYDHCNFSTCCHVPCSLTFTHPWLDLLTSLVYPLLSKGKHLPGPQKCLCWPLTWRTSAHRLRPHEHVLRLWRVFGCLAQGWCPGYGQHYHGCYDPGPYPNILPFYFALSVTRPSLIPSRAARTATKSPDKSPDGSPDHSAVDYHMPSLRSPQHSTALLFNPFGIASSWCSTPQLPAHDGAILRTATSWSTLVNISIFLCDLCDPLLSHLYISARTFSS